MSERTRVRPENIRTRLEFGLRLEVIVRESWWFMGGFDGNLAVAIRCKQKSRGQVCGRGERTLEGGGFAGIRMEERTGKDAGSRVEGQFEVRVEEWTTFRASIAMEMATGMEKPLPLMMRWPLPPGHERTRCPRGGFLYFHPATSIWLVKPTGYLGEALDVANAASWPLKPLVVNCSQLRK